MLPPKPDFLITTEVDDPLPIVGDLFKRKFGHEIPEWKHDLVTFFRKHDGTLVPLAYVKFALFGTTMLVGGGCTDGRTFAHMDEMQKAEMTSSGGALSHILRYGFARFADRCDAYFGYCGNARALEVDLSVGFVPTEHDKLLVHWHKPLNDQTRRALTAMVYALGPF